MSALHQAKLTDNVIDAHRFLTKTDEHSFYNHSDAMDFIAQVSLLGGACRLDLVSDNFIVEVFHEQWND